MPIKAIFANVICYNLETSTEWYHSLFDRGPDARPMTGCQRRSKTMPAGRSKSRPVRARRRPLAKRAFQ
jgi:hypothetical protein